MRREDTGLVDWATIERVETVLKAEIDWAVTKGPGWDPDQGAHVTPQGTWVPNGKCGTCAIGAYLVHNQPKPLIGVESDVRRFSCEMEVDFHWALALYFAIAGSSRWNYRDAELGSEGIELAERLRKYGNMKAAQAAI